ncbi:MAG: glycine cleavage system protein GcvH [Ferrovum sp.]|nr:glycine cleavage system protein GcvH [Ferrovum sp.]NDU88169.1 glycine cleavage system protein GcvH [Ferrovum sp.]
MSSPPHDRRYSPTHQWALSLPDGTISIGITDFAQDQLGDLMFVELLEPGKTLRVGDSCGTLESVKTASEVASPVSGTIIARNDAVKDQPEVLNTHPYDHWLIKVLPSDPAEYANLLTAESYQNSL